MKNYFKLRYNILAANIVNTFQKETAYFANNWGSVFSTTSYTLILILFIKVIFYNVKSFAGYSQNEVFLVAFLYQIYFYAAWAWSENNIENLCEDVNKGNLDFFLIRPVPSLFYVTFREVSIVSALQDGIPLIAYLFLINWKQLPITPLSAFYGLLICILGHIAMHCFVFIMALSIFWLGEFKNIFFIAYSLEDTNNIPLEGFGKPIRFALMTLIPTLLAVQLSASVILGKSSGLRMFLLSLIIAIIFLALKSYFWKKALGIYTSASS